MTDDAVRQFEQALADIPRTTDSLLTVLALCEPLNVSRLTALASAVGLRASTNRQFSTQTLREPLKDLIERRLIHTDGIAFECMPHLRYRLLRRAARQGRLETLGKALAEAQFGGRSLHSLHDRGARLFFEARVALCTDPARADALLEQFARLHGPAEILDGLVIPALQSFDPGWFEQLSSTFCSLWLRAALARIEAQGQDAGGLVGYLIARADRLAADPEIVLTLAGIAVERGDLEALEKLRALPLPDTSASIAAALSVVKGRYSEAANLVPMPRKGTPQGTGLLAILHALALLTRATPADLEFARRLSSAGSRKGVPLRSSFRVLKQIVDRTLEPEGTPSSGHPFADLNEPDCVSPLLRMLWVSWFDSSSDVAAHAVALSRALPPHYSKQGLAWLAAEVEHTAQALSRKVKHRSPRTTLELGLPEKPEASRLSPARTAPLVQMRAEKPPWELVLEGLERLAISSDSSAPAKREPDERVIWRVNPAHRQIEPHLQKRIGGGFSKGRKLSIKHLMPGAQQAASLPPEDARVAAHARELRETYGGYPQVRHHLKPEAFLALVGHPRVFVGDDDTPVEVLRGQVQLLVRRDGKDLVISIEPHDFDGSMRVEHEGRRLFVYALEPGAEPLLKWLKQRLVLPAEAQSRALSVLGRLSHLLPVQSFEETDARKVPADARPWLRITPRGTALSITLSTRPLGAAGPQVKPGHGAPTLLGHLDGKAVQTDRSLDDERRLAQAVLAHCAVLAANEVGEYNYELGDAADCLELISALRALEPQVHVEWPHGKPLRLRARAARSALRGKVSRASDFFLATGSLTVDDELSLELEDLLALVSETPGRFVRLASGDYLELERELREALEGLAAVRSDGRGRSTKDSPRGVTLGKSALSTLEGLLAEGSGFQLDRGTEQFRERLQTAFERQARIPRTLQAELRAYQEEGFRWLARLAELEFGACLADDMGLGKTIQILALLLHRAKSGPALVVAPTSVCDNWRDELARFAPSLEVRWYFGHSREHELERLSTGQVLITSYNLLQQDAQKLQAVSFGTAVLDEAQFIKNADSLRARSACGLDAKMRITATGTPVENHVGDLFGIFQFLMPDLLGSRTSFNKRFPLNAEGEAGVSARRNLRRLIQPFVLRRTKAQVLSELPQLTEIRRTVALTPDEAALYESLRRAAIQKLAATAEPGKNPENGTSDSRADPRAHFQVLAEITRLRRLCCHPALVMPGTTLESSKLSSFLELVEELIEGQHRALVFSQFVDMLDLVRQALDERKLSYQYLDGKTPQPQRKAAVEAFQSGDGDLFLISLRAGGFGLNLTAADYVIHLDPWWNPAVEAQASDRAHRIGQTRPVTVYRLITAHTVEDRIIDLHRTKRDLADSLLEDSDRAAKLTPSELRALLDG